MNITEIRTMSKDFLTPAEVASAMGCDPQSIRVGAKIRPNALGFPVSVVGSRVKIPREGFLRWYDGNTAT